MTIQRTHVRIYGRVQGVFFRQSTFELAQEYKLTGYVRNRLNGSVEAVFEGDESNVRKIIEWSKNGPNFASVQGIEIVSTEIVLNETEKLYQSFSIESTV